MFVYSSRTGGDMIWKETSEEGRFEFEPRVLGKAWLYANGGRACFPRHAYQQAISPASHTKGAATGTNMSRHRLWQTMMPRTESKARTVLSKKRGSSAQTKASPRSPSLRSLCSSDYGGANHPEQRGPVTLFAQTRPTTRASLYRRDCRRPGQRT